MERQDKSSDEAEYYRQLNSNVQNFGLYAYQQLQMQYQGPGMYGYNFQMGASNMMGMPQMMNMGAPYNPGMYASSPYKQYGGGYNYNQPYQNKSSYRNNGGGYKVNF